MFTSTVSAGEVVGTAAGNAVVIANSTAKVAVLVSVCFARGFKAGWLRATTVTTAGRKDAQPGLPAVWVKEIA